MKPLLSLLGLLATVAEPAFAQQLPRTPRSAFGELRAHLPAAPVIPVSASATVDDSQPSFNTESAKVFTPRIQPILANACASCHARKDHAGPFRLRYLSGDYADNESATANLNSALRMISRDQPGESRLLTKALSAHGGAKEPPFRGRGHPAFRNLEVWVHWAAAPEGAGVPNLPPPAVAQQMPNPNPPSLIELTSGRKMAKLPTEEPPAPVAPTHLVLGPKEPGKLPPLPSAEPLPPMSGGFATAPRTSSADPTKINPADEFDPAAFNRAMHPGRK